MPILPRRPRFGRLLDYLVVALLLFVFFGLAVYHYRRLDSSDFDAPEGRLGPRKFAGTDWPQWRGPNRDGVSHETISSDWPSDGPKVLWEQKTGEGFASVAIANGRLFTIFQDAGNEVIVSWDAATGKEFWRRSDPRHYTNYYGNGPRSTPTVDGDFVYTVGGTGVMMCLKAFTDRPNGEVVWSKDLMAEFGASVPQWGVAFSPLVDDKHVYIIAGGKDGKSIAALDKKNGAVVWSQFDDPAGYSSPIAATFAKVDLGREIHWALYGGAFDVVTPFLQERQILFFTGTRLVAVDPDTGAKRWDLPWQTEHNCNIATPIVENNFVFLSSGYGKGCALLQIERDGKAWTPRRVFENRRMKNHFSTCVRHENYLYGFDDSMLTCMNFFTGKTTWKERGFEKGSVLLVNDQLVVYGANGKLALIEANPKSFVEKASFPFSAQGDSCWSAPVVSNGRLYVRDQKKLVCFDVKVKKQS